MNDVFVSYKSEEFDIADWVRTTLEANGISCWMAPMSITGGSSYANEIPQAIRECRFFVLILSEKAQLSKWVPRELDQAINESKTVLPFVLDNCPLKDDFSFYLTNVQRYAAYEDKGAAIDKMIKDIKSMLGWNEAENDDFVSVSDESEDNSDAASHTDSDSNAKPQKSIKTAKKERNVSAVTPKSRKRRHLAPIIIGCIAVFVLLLTAILWTVKSLNTITICGQKFDKNSVSVSLDKAVLTREDIQSFEEFNGLLSVYLHNCTFQDSDISAICTDSCRVLDLNNCGLTDSALKSIDFNGKPISSLILDNNPKIIDFSPISALSDSLTNLSINNCKIDDISFLSDCTKLESFTANNNQIADLSPISNCTRIRSMSVSDNQIDSLKALSEFKKLGSINVGNNKLTDFCGLEKSISLFDVRANNNKISSLKGLENTTLLVKAELNDNSLTDIDVLGKSSANLTKLSLHNNSIENISCLSNCASMKELTIDNNKIVSIDAISKMKKLEKLSAVNNNIADIKAIANCRNLSYINLANNKISSIDAIDVSENKYGITLDVSDNDISALVLKNYKYKYLAVYGNPISDLSQLNKTEGTAVVFDYNEKIDFSKIKGSGYYKYYIFDCPLDKQLDIKNFIDDCVVFTNREDYLAAK